MVLVEVNKSYVSDVNDLLKSQEKHEYELKSLILSLTETIRDLSESLKLDQGGITQKFQIDDSTITSKLETIFGTIDD